MSLEICANSVQSAINAQNGGAQRIELCCNLEQGGLTPSPATIQLVRAHLDIQVFVLIRPRIGGFYYSPLEFELMHKNIDFCLKSGIDGVVFGVLDAQNELDVVRNELLIAAAGKMQKTFHRAFDCLEKPISSLEQLKKLNFDRVLTSGLANTAIEGKKLIKELLEVANGAITILPGSGLNSQNLAEFLQFTNAEEIHASAKKIITPKGNHLFSTPYFETDETEVRQLKAILQQFT